MKDLEKLAISLSDSFLKALTQRGKYANGNERVIILRNADLGTLKALKKHMEDYFRDKNEQVSIHLEGNSGYSISVRPLLN